MQINKAVLTAAVLAVLGATSATAETGMWTPEPSFGVTNINSCYRKYTCAPASAQMYSADQRMVVTEPQTVYGTCSAAGGPIDECNSCLTSAPATPCEWHLEPR